MKTERLERLRQKISAWIGDQVTESGKTTAVVGVSGGVDSALVLKLTAQAVDNTMAVWLPIRNGVDPWQRAASAAGAVGVNLFQRDLTKAYDTVLGDLGVYKGLACANLKARLRMAVLYALANEYDALVVGTTNRSEVMCGYYTKYGDGGVDIEPLASLYKTEVWELAKHVGVPQKIINAEPTADLWPGQTDAQDLGISYKDLDRELRRLKMSWPIEPRHREAALKTQDLVERSEHKRCMPPVYTRHDQPNRALIVVDVQNDFCPGGKLAIPNGHQVVPEINRLMRYFRYIFFTADWHPADHSSFKDQGGPWPAHCIKDTEGARLHSDLHMSRVSRVVRKGIRHETDAYSAFFTENGTPLTTLSSAINVREIREIHIVGLALDVCVKASALDAAELGYDTHVILSGCRAVDPTSEMLAITELKQTPGITVHKDGQYLEEDE